VDTVGICFSGSGSWSRRVVFQLRRNTDRSPQSKIRDALCGRRYRKDLCIEKKSLRIDHARITLDH
jgi:hypothetical protein